MTETRDTPEGYKFLPREEYNQHRGYFQLLTERIRFIGDVDQLRVAREDLEIIDSISSNTGDYQDFGVAAQGLLDIIGSGPDHPLLSKVVATMKYCDLVHGQNIPTRTSQAFMENFNHAVRTEPEQHGSVVLSGALYARLLYHSVTPGGDMGKVVEELHESIAGVADSKEKEINMLGVLTAANTLAEMFDQQALKPRMPVVTIIQNETSNHEQESDATFPDKTMYLGIGYLASYGKLKEAATWGMPDNSKFVLTRRLPRALVGIEVNQPLDNEVKTGSQVVSIKNLVHTNIAPVRPWREDDEKVFDDFHLLTPENVGDSCAFDSLSYWLAVRVSRDLTKNSLKGGNNWEMGLRKVNKWFDNFEETLAHFEDGSEISIVGEALKEYNRRNPNQEVSIEELKTHLRRNALALALEYKEGTVLVRGEDEISELYKTHIWDTQLGDEDKIELTTAFLEDRDYRYSSFTDDTAVNVRLYIAGRQGLTEESKEAVLGYANKNVRDKLVLRFETIRNKEEPETMSQSVFQPDEGQE